MVLEGNAYGGKDRHYGEIAAFYLNLLLGYNNAPITTGRRINFQTELWPVASPTLKDTFFKDSSELVTLRFLKMPFKAFVFHDSFG